jgi:hypothetical protein
MSEAAERTRAILAAYQAVMNASWPALHPEMAVRSRDWASASEAALEAELEGYLRAASQPGCKVRVFWKLGPGLNFAGCNEHFARDAGIPVVELLGRDDFDERLPWVLQAAKYRADDEAVLHSGIPKLDIIERQRGPTGQITWVRVGKAPIRTARETIGVLGMYEVLDSDKGRRLFGEQIRHQTPSQ